MERVRRLADGQVGEAEADRDDGEGQVDEEDGAPAEAVGVAGDEQRADDGAGDRGDAGDRAVERRHALALLDGRIHHLHEGQRLRHHQRGRQALQQPRGDQHLAGDGEAAERRGEREAAHADEQDLAVAEDVAEPPAGDEQEREGQLIAGDDPLDGGIAGAELALDGGDADIDDGRIEQVHAEGEQDHPERDGPPARVHAGAVRRQAVGSLGHGGSPLRRGRTFGGRFLHPRRARPKASGSQAVAQPVPGHRRDQRREAQQRPAGEGGRRAAPRRCRASPGLPAMACARILPAKGAMATPWPE